MNFVAAIASVLIHLFLVAATLPESQKPKPKVEVTLYSMPEVEFLPSGNKENKTEGTGVLSEHKCEGNEYEGIGIIHNLFGTIEAVAPNSPARSAGILVGDRIDYFLDEKTYIHIIWTRGTSTYNKKIQKQLICYRPAPVRLIPGQ